MPQQDYSRRAVSTGYYSTDVTLDMAKIKIAGPLELPCPVENITSLTIQQVVGINEIGALGKKIPGFPKEMVKLRSLNVYSYCDWGDQVPPELSHKNAFGD